MSAKSNSLAKNSLILIFARVVVNISGLAQAFILARVLLKTENGTYQAIITVVGFYVILALGLPEAITYFLSKASSPEEKLRKQSAIMTMGLLAGVLLMILSTLADPLFVSFFHNDQLKGLGWCIGSIIVGNIIQLLFQNTSIVIDRVRDAARMSITYSLGNILVVSSLLVYKNSIQLFIYILAAYNLLMLLLRLGTIWKYFDFKLKPVWDMKLFREIFSYSIPICFATAIGTVSRYMDRAVIGLFYSTEQLADYAQGARELPYSIVTGAIIAVLMPKVIKNYNDGVINQSISLWQKGMVASSYLIFFAIASNILLSREIITVMYSDKYIGSVPYFIVYTFLLVSRITYWGMFLQAMKKPKLVMYVSIFSLLSNLLLNFAFIQIFGMIGAALSAVITSYVSVGLYLYLNCKYLNVRVRDFLPYKKIAAIVGVNAAAFCLFGAMKYFFIDSLSIGNDFVNNIFKILLIGGLWAGGYALVFRKDLSQIRASLK